MKKALAKERSKITHKVRKIIREEVLALISKALDDKFLALISKAMDEKLPVILDALNKNNFVELFEDRLHSMSTTKVIPLFVYMFFSIFVIHY